MISRAPSSCHLRVVVALLLLACAGAALAAIETYEFPDLEMRERYNALVAELRCPQCLNTNLAGSDSMIAKDLRREIHRLVLAGRTDDEIRQFMHQRYGDFILYRPRLTARTLLLWGGPLVILGIGVAVFVVYVRSQNRGGTDELDADDQAQLAKLLDE